MNFNLDSNYIYVNDNAKGHNKKHILFYSLILLSQISIYKYVKDPLDILFYFQLIISIICFLALIFNVFFVTTKTDIAIKNIQFLKLKSLLYTNFFYIKLSPFKYRVIYFQKESEEKKELIRFFEKNKLQIVG